MTQANSMAMSNLADLDVPEHIRTLHVTWLNVVRWFHLCCEDLGIQTIGQLLDARQEELRVLKTSRAAYARRDRTTESRYEP